MCGQSSAPSRNRLRKFSCALLAGTKRELKRGYCRGINKNGSSDFPGVDGCHLRVEAEARRRKRYPLVLMLEPLFRCNLACAGCGKVQYPPHILKTQLTPEECFAAVEECGAPMVSIPGGEPLLHPQMVEIVNGLVARKKYVYMCTNALELKKQLHEFTPSKYLTFSVHLDGQREHHDFSVCREGGYDIAVEGIKEAVKRGLPRHDEFDVLRWNRSEQRARAL